MTKSAERMTDVIVTTLNCFNNATNKLVSQTYDGAAVMAGTLSGVQSRLKSKGFYTRSFHSLLRSYAKFGVEQKCRKS